MKTKVRLKSFLEKRRLTLGMFCKNRGIKSHESLSMALEDLGVETPDSKDTKVIFAQKPRKVSSKSKSSFGKKSKTDLAQASSPDQKSESYESPSFKRTGSVERKTTSKKKYTTSKKS